jgi:hypothetical protein
VIPFYYGSGPGSGSGTVINYGSGSDFLARYGSSSGSGSASQKLTVTTVPVPVPQRCLEEVILHWWRGEHCQRLVQSRLKTGKQIYAQQTKICSD